MKYALYRSFPNHWTIITGVYPQIHGVVANRVYDPSYDRKIYLVGERPLNLDTKWWNRSDPLWLTASRQGLKTGAYFWPGSDTYGRNPGKQLAA